MSQGGTMPAAYSVNMAVISRIIFARPLLIFLTIITQFRRESYTRFEPDAVLRCWGQPDLRLLGDLDRSHAAWQLSR